MQILKDGYVKDYQCTCGSLTYGHLIQKYDLSLGKIVNGILCGGCNKFTLEGEYNE